jgi:hypothetical protein
MPGLSARALKLLRPAPNQIKVPKAGSVIPQALRSEKTPVACTGPV